MTPADLDALAALHGQMTKGPWCAVCPQVHVHIESPAGYIMERSYGVHNERDAAGIVALVNAAPDLLRLARKGLTQDGPCYCCRESGCLDGCRCRVGLEDEE